jgi:hypothetical protein
MNNRTFTRAAGVSPPWFSEPHLQVQCAEFPRIELVCKVHSTGGLRPPLLVGDASATGIMRIPAASSTGTSLRTGTGPAHMRIPSADSIRSPRGAYAPRSWLRMRTLLQMCDSGRRKRCFSTGGLRPPLLLLIRRASAGRMTIFAMNKRTSTRAAGVSPPWFSEPHLEVQCDEVPRLDRACGVHSTRELTPPLLVAQCRFAGENDSRGAHRTSLQKTTFAVHKRRFTRAAPVSPPWQADRDGEGSASFSGNPTPSRAASVSPPWLSEPHLQVQCDEFPRFEFACGVHPTGDLRPPLVAACATHRVRYAFPIRNGGCVPRGLKPPRSWSAKRALGELWVFQQQIRPEHRCVRKRAQHTCVFHLQTRYVHHGWRTPSAPGCVCGRCCKCAILADGKDTFPRGAYAPRSCRRYNEHPQEERRFL